MRLRLTISGLVVALITLVVFWISIGALARAGIVSDQRDNLRRLAEGAASAEPGPRPPVLVEAASDTAAFLVLVNHDGSPQYSGGMVRGAAPVVPAALIIEAAERGESSAVFTIGDTELAAEAVRWESSRATGVAIALQSTAFREEQLQGVRGVLAVASLLTLAAAAIIAWFVAGRALRPLNALAATADEIGRTGDVTRRLAPSRRKDQVQRLTRSFNSMLERLEASTRSLEAAVERERRLVADASHELRTPLTTIRSNAGFLADNPEAAAADRIDAIEDIRAESDRMARLVSDLLALARWDAGRPLERARVAVLDLARTVSARFPETLADGDAAVVLGDQDQLTQLLTILVDNAHRHGRLPVEIGVSSSGDGVTIDVDDRGSGVPPVRRELVFERFHRGDLARSDGGSGLGLAIARHIAVAHGGSVEVGDRPGGGARFRVRLPLAGS